MFFIDGRADQGAWPIFETHTGWTS